MRDLPGDKSQTRSGLLRGWLRCAIMRIVNVGVFSFFFIPPMYQHLGQHQRRGGGKHTEEMTLKRRIVMWRWWGSCLFSSEISGIESAGRLR